MTKIWIDILAVIFAVSLLDGAMRGAFYSSGRGGNRPLIATVKSVRIRLVIGVLGIVVFAWAISDFLKKTWLHSR